MVRALILGCWLLGAAALAIAPFLNWYDIAFAPPGGDVLASGEPETGVGARPAIGVALIVIAAAAVIAATATYLTGARWLPLASCLLAAIAVGLVFYAFASPPEGQVGTLNDARQSFIDAREEFDPTLGLGVALVAAAAILAASIAAAITTAVSDARKRCPDCAKHIAGEARVCRFCGYRFT